MLLFFIGIFIGIFIASLVSILVLILYSRQEQIITRFIDRSIANKEKAQFFEPITPEEKINEIFKQ